MYSLFWILTSACLPVLNIYLMSMYLCLVSLIFGSDFGDTLYFTEICRQSKFTVFALLLPLPCESALGSRPLCDICTEVHYTLHYMYTFDTLKANE